MLHTKFQGYLSTGSGVDEDFSKDCTIYWRGGHTRHVTWTV